MLPALPPDLAVALRPVLPDLAEATIAAIARDVPEYARPLGGPFGEALRTGVERAHARFVDLIEDPGAPDAGARTVYVNLGRGEQRAGRSLDVLLRAYRLGARLAWEHFVAAAEDAGHEPATLYRLAAAIFEYIDAISAESVEGYLEEQSRALSERARRRRALARMLARDDVPETELSDLALRADWPLPATVAALVLDVAGEDEVDPDRLAGRLGPDVVADADGDVVLAFLPDPEAPGRRPQLEAALAGRPAALGPEVAAARAHHSLSRALAAHRARQDGRIPGEAGLVLAEEHLVALLLHGGDGSLAADLAARALAPLQQVGPGPRARLTETLRAWLDHPGQVQHVAALLDVHPQTVRYRVRQLRDLFGARLDDADDRFELALALRSGGG